LESVESPASLKYYFFNLTPFIAPTNTATIGADPLLFTGRNLHVTRTMTGTMKDVDKALDYAKRGLLKQICEVRPLTQVPESVKQLRRGEVLGRIVIDANVESNLLRLYLDCTYS
jgi:D-arabinose 1-dehydrogenase-like Zn-dependent alcohol dehydrogenase